MFISKSKTSFSTLVGLVICLFGGSTAVFWFLGVVLSLTEQEGINWNNFNVSWVICLVGILITYLGIRKIKLVNKAKMLDNIFCGDKDGEIPLSTISNLLGMKESKFMELFQKLISKGYIINASLNNENGHYRIVLNSGTTKNIEYTVVKCEGCGASNSVRKGFVGKCIYCGSDIKE